jgi:hypothetical protein
VKELLNQHLSQQEVLKFPLNCVSFILCNILKIESLSLAREPAG